MAAENSYNAGSLDLAIMGVATDVIKTLDAVIGRLDLIEGSLGGVKSKSRSVKTVGSNKGNGFLNAAKWTASIYLARRMAMQTAKIVKAGSDYLETMNLWQVAMRNNLDLADEFVNKMNKANGVSAKTTMQAQATFKNMIGSLGDLSDETAYQLSEAITQMAFDYSSLYNVKLTQAVEKFQSALAGQVRPIRSISGYDITEKTIHALYQSIGGTKTQRQLSRTEKQLLAILAVFRQMEASGATGDLGKTLNMLANQSRMMAENFIELKSWTGMLVVDLFESWGIMVKINALLITITTIVKAIAKSRGVGEENFVDGIFESAENANEEIDELQGKLLDFDKFRSLSGQDAGADIAIDQKLLEAISGYSSVIEKANNEAQELADTWLKFWINEETGGLSEDAERVLGILEGLVKFGTILLGLKIGTWIAGLVKGIGSITIASKGLHNVLIAGIIYAIWEAIDAFREGDTVSGIIAITIGVTLVGALVAFEISQKKAAIATKLLTAGIQEQNLFMQAQGLTMAKTSLSIKGVGVAILSAVAAFAILDGVISGLDGTSRKTVSIISIVVGALATLLGVILAIKGGIKGGLIGATIAGIGVGALIAGIKGVATKEAKIPNCENGASDIDSGTVFRAGEFGKTEAVYTGSNGKTNVANVRQMEQAFYNALSRYGSENGGTIVVETYLDGEKVYQNTTEKAKARGNVWAKA